MRPKPPLEVDELCPESGSFGKSARRSRSKTGTPAKREDPTIQAADKVFSHWILNQGKSQGSAPASTATTPQRKGSVAQSQSGLGSQQALDDSSGAASSQPRFVKKKEPTEVVLRGYRSSEQQYAAISHYEQLAGRICEDYPRDPPVESRRYKSELRDPAFTRRERLTPEERAKVNKADGGEHWIKVTFESAEAADAAIFASPQAVMGHLVYAEPYLGVPPLQDDAVPDRTLELADEDDGLGRSRSRRSGRHRANAPSMSKGRSTGATPFDNGSQQPSPPQSQSSSRTAETGTLTGASSNTAATSTTATWPFTPTGDLRDLTRQLGFGASGPSTPAAATADNNENSLYCRAIPSARKVRLLPAEQALLPQPSYTQRVLNMVPFLRWFSGSMIGNEVPRTDGGDFDWDRASLYWKVIWWLDATFGLFGGEILSADKED